MADNNAYYAYIGTNSVRGSQGIYSVRIDAVTLEPEIIQTVPAYNSGSLAMCADGGFLYAAVEGMTFEGYASGGIIAYKAAEDGMLEKLNEQRTFGQRTCCVAADASGQNAYACNFYEGTMAAFHVEENGAVCPARFVVYPPEET